MRLCIRAVRSVLLFFRILENEISKLATNRKLSAQFENQTSDVWSFVRRNVVLCMKELHFNAVDSDIFARILFSRILLKDILVMREIRY